jgi:predicted DsbA family dithiol-disulfide isomerase
MPIQIDVYADIACPWCYIGEQRLQRAMGERPDLDAERRWRPFQLQPQMPPEGRDWQEFAERKFGGPDRMETAFEQVAEAGEDVGLDFRFDRVVSAPNTTDAHRLVLWAAGDGRAWPMAEALFRAYFTGGRDLNDTDDLAAVVEEADLDPEAARTFLATNEHAEAVEASQREAKRRGVTGVPFYVFNDEFGVSGAQPAEVFQRAFDEAQSSSSDAATASAA